MCWQREGGIGDDGDGGREDSLNADDDDDAHSYVGCKDAKGVASVGRFEKGSPKLFGQGQGTGLGSLGHTRATRVRKRMPHKFTITFICPNSRFAERPPNTDKMKLVRRRSRPSSPPPPSSSSAFFLLSCICIQTVCSLPFSSHRTHVENRLGELRRQRRERSSTKYRYNPLPLPHCPYFTFIRREK